MIKKIGTVLGAAAVALTLTAGVAVATTTYRFGGATERQYFATNDQPWNVGAVNVWQTVPNTIITVGLNRRHILHATYGAESLCQGGGWCSVRIVYASPAGVVELAPQSGADYAFDSDGDLWDQHAVSRSSAYLAPGIYRVWVQAMRVNATNFRLDDSHFQVELVSP